MAHGRYAALTRYYFTNNVKQHQIQLCLRRLQSHQSETKMTCPLEVYQRLFRKIDLLSCIQENNFRSFEYDWNGAFMLITGGSKGIGAHIVRLGLEEGVKNVANLDIDERSGLALKYELNQRYGEKDKVKYFNCDVTDEQQLIQQYQSILSDKEKTFVVVNNAELLNKQRRLPIDEEIDTIRTGLVTSNLTALDLMRTDKNGRGGTIINISSAAALCPSPLNPENKAIKQAVMTLSIGLGNDEFFRRSGVRVITICYGASDAAQDGYDTVSENESEPKFSTVMQPFCHQCTRIAAQAIIDIYKHGRSGSVWVTKESKPIEDISYMVRNSYSSVLVPNIFNSPYFTSY